MTKRILSLVINWLTSSMLRECLPYTVDRFGGQLYRRSDHIIHFCQYLLVCIAWLYVDLMLAVCRLYAACRMVCSIIWPYVGHRVVRVF